MNAALAFPLFAIVATASLLMTGWVATWLRQRQILDHPNARSSHQLPTPRGGGLAIVPLVVTGWALALIVGADASAIMDSWNLIAVLAAAVVLAVVSWVDDRRSLQPLPRLGVQALAVVVGTLTLPDDMLVLQGVAPQWLDHVLTGLAWLWFINLYNFMDGIDGITGVETASIGGGVMMLALIGLVPTGFVVPGVALSAAAFGFLVWNWHPARLFMGDVGSVPLGYLIGFLLVVLACNGHLATALILPLYYLVDATITLLRRLIQGEKPWTPHRSHLYQLAVRGGLSHGRASGAIAVTNLGLIGCAIGASSGFPVAGAVGATVLVLVLCGGFLLVWRRETDC